MQYISATITIGLRGRLLIFFINIIGNGSSSQPWRHDVPQVLRKQAQIKRNRNSGNEVDPTTVLFVPNSNQSILLKRLENKDPQLSRLSG